LAQQIVDCWEEETSPLSSPSSSSSSLRFSCDSASIHSRKRRISQLESKAKRRRVDGKKFCFDDHKMEQNYRRFSDRVDEAIRNGLLPHPSNPSYAGVLADFVYGEEETKKNIKRSVPLESFLGR
ncbi:hypothetical protein PMAYCL1PPCAC_28672, partial [Pristionchus mayeri]